MKVDASFLNPGGNGVAALTLVVALLDALQSSETISATQIREILAGAKSLLAGDRSIEQEGRAILDSVTI